MQASPGTWTPEHGWALRGRATAEARPRISPSEADASATKKLKQKSTSKSPVLEFSPAPSLPHLSFSSIFPFSHPTASFPLASSFLLYFSFLLPFPLAHLPPLFPPPSPLLRSSLLPSSPFHSSPLAPPIPSVTQLWPDYLLYELNNSICEKTKLPRHCS